MNISSNPNAAFANNLHGLSLELEGMITHLEKMMVDGNGGQDLLSQPLLPENGAGRMLGSQGAARVLAGDNTPNPLGQPLPQTDMAERIAQTAMEGGNAGSPAALGTLLAELNQLGEQSPQAMMAGLLGHALGAVDEQGFFGEGGMLEAAANDDGGGLLGGLLGDGGGGDDGGLLGGLLGGGDDGGGLLGGLLGGGDDGGGLLGGLLGGGGPLGAIASGIGELVGGDAQEIIGGVLGTVANFAGGNFLGGALTAVDTISGLMDEGNNPTMNAIGGVLGMLEQNFGQALASSI